MSTFESFLKRIVESAFSVDFNSRIVFFLNINGKLKLTFWASWNFKILIHFRSYIWSFLFFENLENFQNIYLFQQFITIYLHQITRTNTHTMWPTIHVNINFAKIFFGFYSIWSSCDRSSHKRYIVIFPIANITLNSLSFISIFIWVSTGLLTWIFYHLRYT